MRLVLVGAAAAALAFGSDIKGTYVEARTADAPGAPGGSPRDVVWARGVAGNANRPLVWTSRASRSAEEAPDTPESASIGRKKAGSGGR